MFLGCHSHYSLRFGTLSVDDLARGARFHGAEAAALTDINATTGIYDFIRSCKKEGVKPLIGVDFRNGDKHLYTGLCRNRTGLGELCRIQTASNLSKEALPEKPGQLQHCHVIYPMDRAPEQLADNEWIGVRPDQANRLIRFSRQRLNRCVIYQPVSFHSTTQFELHRLLRGVHHNVVLSKLGASSYARSSDHFIPIETLIGYYLSYPVVIRNTKALINDCNFDFDFKSPKNKKVYTASRYEDRLLLEKLALDGSKRRYGKHHVKSQRRIQRELEIIDKMGLSGYFLIAWDVVQYSMSRGFFHVGRGSGANSIVSYCLGITNICPLELNLFFERFLNPSRTSPPDFDIDWSWKDRDEILSYVFNRFDSTRTAFMGTIGSFKHRSIVRELGKVYGLPKEELDKLSQSPAEEHAQDSIVSNIHRYGRMLEGAPNLRGLHACGIIISEDPLTDYTILDLPPKGFPTVQFDMYIGEEIGFEKLDILSQRGLGHIADAIDLVQQNQGVSIDIHEVDRFKYDPKLNEQLSKGMTLGCFYIESPAMRGLLRRLSCNNYETLVAASSVIRPGVAKSGMMREYVFRHNFPNQFEYFHPIFEEHLGDTYGVMVYQEDVIKIAHHFAGLDLADADVLRRAMSGKTRSQKQFEAIRQRFFRNCKERGYPDELAAEVYRQIESFAGFSFCKAHSASYSVESYQSLFLKAYYPLEFLVAVINNFGGFYRTEVYVHEARMSGAKVEPPCINQSQVFTSIRGKRIILGFVHLHNLGENMAEMIEAERQNQGDFDSVEDFIKRVPVSMDVLQSLIFVGAFRRTGIPKNELFLQARLLLGEAESSVQPAAELFRVPTREFQLPELKRSHFEDAFDEIELLGFPVSFSPFELLQTSYRGDTSVKDLPHMKGKKVRMVAYLISRKHVPTTQGLMNFGTWIDPEGLLFDSTHFADSLAKFPFAGGGCYLMEGIVDVDYTFPTLIVSKLAKLPFIPDPRYGSDEEERFQVQGLLKEDVSRTHRAPYPKESEIGLPRHRMGEAPVKRR